MKLFRLSLVIITSASLLLLAGCWSAAPVEAKKSPFIIQVNSVAAFSAQWGFVKVGVVSSTEQVTVSSQVAWRVTDIVKKIGNKVWTDQLILSMKDIAGNNLFSTRRAAVWLNNAEDSLSQQQLALQKSLFDATIGLQKNQINSSATRQDIGKQQEKLTKDLSDNDLGISGSNLSLQLDKLNTDIAKAQLDYQTRLDSDNQTILNFMNNVKLVRSDLWTIFNDTISAADELLGVSVAREHNNDAFEHILWNKDFYALNRAQEALRKWFTSYEEFKSVSQDVNVNTMSGLLITYQESIAAVNTLLFEVENLMNATQPWGALTDAVYAWYKAQIDGLQAKASAMGSSINAQLNAINTFFATYKQSQASLAKWIDSLQAQLELSKRGVQDTEYNTQLAADRQKLNLDSVLKNTELTDESTQYNLDFVNKNNQIALDVMQNALQQAQIAYDEAVFGSTKFNLLSPIPWTVTDILVDRGQEVSPWTPLFTVVNTELLQVELDVTAWEKELVVPGQIVSVNQGGIVWKWIVESVSDAADRNFGYKIIIVITEGKFDIGSSIQVQFVGTVGENVIIPLNAVNVVDNGRWVVQLWKWGKIVPTVVWLGSMAGEYVMITDGIAIDDLIITSDISNFDPLKMEVRVKS